MSPRRRDQLAGAIVATCALSLCGCQPPLVVGRECTAERCGQDPACSPCDAGTQCGGPSQRITRAGLDMYVMLDASSSLIFSWSETKQGFSDFLMQPASNGVGVGLQFFGESCDAASYATPAIPIAALPDNADPLVNAFPWAPTLETPTLPALQGALSYARDWQSAHPTRTAIVTLITDSFPEECDSTTQNVTLAAREGLADTPPIRTFLVGIDSVGDIFSFVNQVTAAAGTPAVTVPAQSAAELSRALGEVRDAAAACLYASPEAPAPPNDSGWLQHTAPDGTVALVPVVEDDLHCDPVEGGVYAQPNLPGQLRSCPASCAILDAEGELELLQHCSSSAVASYRLD